MAGPPRHEFGRRKSEALPDVAPPKRSHHVALLVMGTLAVGGGAYALMPRGNCQPPQSPSPGMAAPAQPQINAACGSRGSSGSGSYSGTHYGFFAGSSSSTTSPGSASASGGVTRGGFGSFAHAFGFSGSS